VTRQRGQKSAHAEPVTGRKIQRGTAAPKQKSQGKLDRRGLKTQQRERQKSTAKQALAQELI
jgi:hypothetical protein